MTIVQVITGSASIGGAQAHVRDLVAGLTQSGHKCTVLVGPPDGLFCDQLRALGIQVKILSNLQKMPHPSRDFLALVSLMREFCKLKPDIVAAHTAKAGFLARLAAAILGIPCVFTPHGLSIIERGTGRTNSVFSALERIGGRLGSGMIAVCRDEQKLAKSSGVVPARKLFAVYNGIPDCAQEAAVQSDEISVLMVARFQEQKDHGTLLKALALLADFPWKLRLAGSGPLMAATRKLARSLGLEDRIAFLGECADTPSLLAESSIFVLSTFWEAFPISILEAMRAGVPVIASNVGGIQEAIVDGVNGLLVPPCRPDLLARSLKMLFEDRLLREQLAAQARMDYLTFFTAEQMVERTLDVYKALVCRAPAPC